MFHALTAIGLLLLVSPAYAVTGNAPPAAGWAARAIVMIVDAREDLCTGTALAPDLVLTAAHCVVRNVDYQVKARCGEPTSPPTCRLGYAPLGELRHYFGAG